MKSFPCPQCQRQLEPSGAISLGGAELPVYQCDTCLKSVKFMGEAMDLPLTFALDRDGRPFDPGDLDDQPGDDPATDDSE